MSRTESNGKDDTMLTSSLTSSRLSRHPQLTPTKNNPFTLFKNRANECFWTEEVQFAADWCVRECGAVGNMHMSGI